MYCRIADLVVEVPEAGGMAPRCREYQIENVGGAEIVIRADHYNPEKWPGLTFDQACYVESGFQFYRHLLSYNGMMLHASAVELDGYGYLFSAHCGVGKSTHTRLWQEVFGQSAQVFNDDKPALRRINGRWYAYGTPWCGKDGINQNKKVPLGGICFLKRAQNNKIRCLNAGEAVGRILSQTPHRFHSAQRLDVLLSLVDNLVREIPVFELENVPEPQAARMSHDVMCLKAKELF